jgi:hydroxymethylglutaryl-CoA reductase
MKGKFVKGFSKWSKAEKLEWIAEHLLSDPEKGMEEISSFWHQDTAWQKVLDGFSENTLSNFPLPFGVAPNFLINGHCYVVPMVIEESSVVAAASNAAKYWSERGGFHAEVVDMEKVGQVHFYWYGSEERWASWQQELEDRLLDRVSTMTQNMVKRGGGILSLEWKHLTDLDDGFRQLSVTFDTRDSMGANFINSVLEEFAQGIELFLATHEGLSDSERNVEIVMSILSNYTPNCKVIASVECPIDQLGEYPGHMSAEEFANKFCKAVRISRMDPYRAVTHNKGIYNGIDAVVIATGNDFRAIEACGHAYAARDGQYRGLSNCSLENGIFKFWLEVPMAVGTVGGLTALHPLAKYALEMLGNPSAEELMMIIASMGLAQNYAAVRSLITTGIQYGHMKMHLQNILHQLGAGPDESEAAKLYFCERTVSFSAVREFLEQERAK